MGTTVDASGKPTITPTPTQTVADMNAIVTYVDLTGGVLKGTAAQRDDLTPDQSKPGWLFSEVDTNLVYKRVASGWIPVVDPGTALLPFSEFNAGGGWSAANVNGFTGVWYQRRNGILFCSGAAQNSGSWSAGSVIMTLPAGFRPPKRWVGTGVEIDTAGDIMTQGGGSGVWTFQVSFPVA